MKVLLAIFSCLTYNYTATDCRDWFIRTNVDRVQGIRDSWLKDVTGDYKIFKGRRTGIHDTAVHLHPDEVWLDVNDDYHHSAEKLRALIRWALDHGYDYVVKVDDDVYVYYDRLMANLPTADYVGCGHGRQFAPGFTYCLSRRAMEELLAGPAGCWAEDRATGESLRRKGIYCTHEPRFHLVKPTKATQWISDSDLLKPNDWLTFHSASPDQMRRLYKHEQSLKSAVITQQV